MMDSRGLFRYLQVLLPPVVPPGMYDFLLRDEKMLGNEGGTIITDTGAWTGKCNTITVLEDTVFSLLTGNMEVQGTLGDAAFPKNHIVRGNFTAITLASGAVIAYNAPKGGDWKL